MLNIIYLILWVNILKILIAKEKALKKVRIKGTHGTSLIDIFQHSTHYPNTVSK